MAASKFSTGGYNLLENNCNNFSNDFASFLTGTGIPVSIWNANLCKVVVYGRWQPGQVATMRSAKSQACQALMSCVAHAACSMLQAATCWGLHAA